MNDISNKKIRGKYIYHIENIEVKGDNPEILFWLALPVNHKGQEIKINSFKPHPNEVINDPVNGNKVAFWRLKDLANNESCKFEYNFEILTKDVEHNIDLNKIEPYNTKSELFKRYTRSEKWIEITPEISHKAHEIIGDESNPYLKAKKIFDWIISYMKFEYPDLEHRGAKKSIKNLKGDCGEFSYLFTALCRAVNIPSRAITCNWPTQFGHVWAELLIPPYGWIPVDTSMAQDFNESMRNFTKVKNDNHEYLFGNLYPNRIIVFIGSNVELYSKTENINRTFQVMQPGGILSVPTSIEFNNITENVVHTGFYLFEDEIENKDYIQTRIDKELAHHYYRNGDYLKAEVGLLAKIKDNPKDSISLLDLGQIYMKTDKIEKAIESFKNCISGNSGSLQEVMSVWAYNLLGKCHQINEDFENAKKYFNIVIDKKVDFQGSLEFAKSSLEEIS